jgi:two-component system CheB/CheR fusion protein
MSPDDSLNETPAEMRRDDSLPAISPDGVEEEMGGTMDSVIPAKRVKSAPVVGIGGSAGSIDALQTFFSGMPADSGIAFVVVVHLPSEHESALAEILSRTTKMVVKQATEGQRIRANEVYVIPPGKLLTVAGDHLRLTPLERDRGKRVAVDLLFRTLADSQGPNSVAIVLSGADGDGAIGIKRIKERGGLTVAQDPDEAEHPSMPRAAIDTGTVDWVLKVQDMPARLLKYQADEARLRLPSEEGPFPALASEAASVPDEAALRELLSFLRTRTGRDFSYYKRPTILRRIARRMQVNGVLTLPDYLAFVRTHPGETRALQQDLLISVTNFYRDREAFLALEAQIPALFTGKSQNGVVRAWVPACATGEEAYSIAILLLEYAGTLDGPPAVQVFATDLDEEAIVAAREGLFPLTIAADVSEDRLRRFFIKEHRGYRARRELRECILFTVRDLLKDAPFSRIDLISCRNLLIYLNRSAQERALQTFHFSLLPNRLLFLGSSESVDEENPHFTVVDKKHRLYRQQPSARVTVPIPLGPSTVGLAIAAQERTRTGPVVHGAFFTASAAAALARESESANEQRVSWEELHFKLIERFAPPSLIVTREYDIVHVSENAGRFLHFRGGEPTINLLDVVHPMMRVALRATLFRAAQSSAPAETFRVPVELDGKTVSVDIRVAPAQEVAPDYMLVVFAVREATGEEIGERLDAEPVIRNLEREIEQMKSRLRHTVQQHERSTEELKASNEELQAMNEELRSATEELETSREELQSINEELTTVNQELKSKVDELGLANSDLSNLVAATAIATLFVDRRLRITRYTPSAVDLFNIIPSDIGRPLSDLTHRLHYPQLQEDCDSVLHSLVPVRREIPNSDGRWYLAQILPYRTTEDRIAGAVLTFVDITESRASEIALREAEERMRFATEAADIYAWETNPETSKTYFAQNAQRVLGFTPPESVAEMVALIHPEDREMVALRFERAREEKKRFDAEFRFVNPDSGEIVWQSSHGIFIERDPGKTRFVGITQNIGPRKQAEEALRASEARLAAIFEQASIGLSEISLDGRFLRVNEELCRITGRSQKELLASTFAQVTHEEDAARSRAAVQLAIDSGEATTLDKRCLQPNGTLVWTSSSIRPLLDEHGKPESLLGVTTDLTARREAERALREAESRFRAVANLIPDLLWSNEPNGETTWVNQRWLDFTGQTLEQAKGYGWLDSIHREDRENSRRRFQSAIDSGEILEQEHRLCRHDGECRWFLVRAEPLRDSTGRILQWFGSATDIEDMKRFEADLATSEQRLRLVVDNAREYAIFSTDLEGCVTSWNPGAERLLGHSEKEILGESAKVIFTDEDRATGAPEREMATAAADGRATDERWHMRKDGSTFWGSGVMMAMRSPQGAHVGYVKILRDQTSELRAKEALERSREELWEALQDNERARKEAEAAGRAKDHFLAVLSHELRTPLTPVLMGIRTISRRRDLAPEVLDILQMIDRNVKLEARFIDDLLDVTRIARGKMEIAHEAMDLHLAIQHAIDISLPDIQVKRQKLTVQLEAKEHTLAGDSMRLQQVFWNLLKNASKFTPEGGQIHVASRSENGRMIVTVRDSGMGFEGDSAIRIFDPFVQASQSVTRQYGGLGLGLAISKAAVESHGGIIRAESPGSGKGATFIVELPVGPPDQPHEPKGSA